MAIAYPFKQFEKCFVLHVIHFTILLFNEIFTVIKFFELKTATVSKISDNTCNKNKQM